VQVVVPGQSFPHVGDNGGVVHELDADMHLSRHLAELQHDLLVTLSEADDAEGVRDAVRVGMQLPPRPLVHTADGWESWLGVLAGDHDDRVEHLFRDDHLAVTVDHHVSTSTSPSNASCHHQLCAASPGRRAGPWC